MNFSVSPLLSFEGENHAGLHVKIHFFLGHLSVWAWGHDSKPLRQYLLLPHRPQSKNVVQAKPFHGENLKRQQNRKTQLRLDHHTQPGAILVTELMLAVERNPYSND